MNKISQTTSIPSRIHSLDLLRGIALLGILVMNIHAFAHPGSAYLNPLEGAGLDGYNFHLWNLNWLFADMKFLGTFSMLFGAGVMLFTDNLKVKGMNQAKWHYKRMFFLLIFGLIHAYGIWAGDILVAYSLCGSFIFIFRNASIHRLGVWAGILFCVPILLSAFIYLAASQQELSEIFDFWTSNPKELSKQIAAYRSGWLGQFPYRAKGALALETVVFMGETFWHASGMMLLGALLFRSKVLSAERSQTFYLRMALIGLGLGLSISTLGLVLAHGQNWNGLFVMTIGRKINYISSVPMALGYMGLAMFLYKKQVFPALLRRLQSAGRMAFTNYILMSVLCAFIFWKPGFGLVGELDRLELNLIVLGVWGLILLISPLILQRFRQGPLEWLWRKLTYSGFTKKG